MMLSNVGTLAKKMSDKMEGLSPAIIELIIAVIVKDNE